MVISNRFFDLKGGDSIESLEEDKRKEASKKQRKNPWRWEMFKRAVIGLVVVLLMGFAAFAAEQVHLGWSTNDVYTTMTVNWWSPTKEPQGVVYGLSSQDNPAKYDFYKEGVAHQIAPKTDVFGNPITKVWQGYYYQAKLTGLKPGTTYYFRVGGNSGFTREWKFRTIGRNEDVKFVFGGDSRRPYSPNFIEVKRHPEKPMNWPFARDFITQSAAAENPDFIIFNGDFVGTGSNQSQWKNWLDAWQKYAVTKDGRMIPIVAIPGNHEYGAYPNKEASPDWFSRQFALPGEPYSLDFPNLHITALNATFTQITSHGAFPLAKKEAESQLAWLTKDLQSNAQWKLVVFHVNYFGCFKSGTGYPSDPYMQTWTKVFQDNHVNIVFMAHTHNYTRTWPIMVTGFKATKPPSVRAIYRLVKSSEEGITYIVQGGWGAAPDFLTATGYCSIRDYIAAAVAHPCYSIAKVNGSKLTLITKDTTGKVLDKVTFPYATNEFPTPEYQKVVH